MGNIPSHHSNLDKTQTDTRLYPPRTANSSTSKPPALLARFGAAKARIHRTLCHKTKPKTKKHSQNSHTYPTDVTTNQPGAQNSPDNDKRQYRKYQYPIDEQEQDRLIHMHFLLKQCFDGNFSAPVRNLLSRTALTSWDSSSINRVSWATSATAHSTQSSLRNTWVRQSVPPRVLDIACGTGTWAMEMAVEFPFAEVHGIDSSEMYPLAIKPPNVWFTKADVLDPAGLPYPSEYFDYVHMQLVYCCFSRPDWTTIIKEIRRVLKPGGYVEFRELDPILHNPGPVTDGFLGALTKGMGLHGINSFWSRYLCQYIERPGDMTDVHHQIVSVGVGWGRTLADMTYQAVEQDFRAAKRLVRTALSISSEEYDSTVTMMMNEMRPHKTYENYHMCWGRKPLLDLDCLFYDRQINIPRAEQLHPRLRRMSSMSCLEGKMSEEERRRKDTVSDIYQFVEGYNGF
ncbi:S-adenosyl-L-methionine-dependent methyltransferase [Phycomyces nitens]|nr:S-adenosyl-L-methionine-dependent methyltransferase [Phycomyces nitens]